MKRLLIIAISLSPLINFSQTDQDVLRDIYKQSLTNSKSYDWLNYLSNEIGGRLTGSLNAEKAVAYTKAELEKLALDKVWLQPVKVPKWVRGAKEHAYIETGPNGFNTGKTTTVNICALGGSIATPALGLKANVIEVKNFEHLKTLGRENIAGKIVFFNTPMQADLIDTNEAYQNILNISKRGALEASQFGAVGVIVRSMTLTLSDFPHTESMTYENQAIDKRIPAAAISTNDAEVLSAMLKLDESIKFYFKQNCKQLKEVTSHNVIAEITGSEYPDEYLIVGAHLDSWDLGDGAHDNGAGVVQSMDVLRLIKALGIKPKRSIRVVLFMNKENGLDGAKKYAGGVKQNKENHIFALENDAGGFSPQGFTFNCSDSNFNQILHWKALFKPYLIHYFERGTSAENVEPLKNDHNVLASLKTNSQRYFEYQHAALDTFNTVNKRELELGAATMTALLYLFDKYGIN